MTEIPEHLLKRSKGARCRDCALVKTQLAADAGLLGAALLARGSMEA